MGKLMTTFRRKSLSEGYPSKLPSFLAFVVSSKHTPGLMGWKGMRTTTV